MAIKTALLNFTYNLNPNIKLYITRMGLWLLLSYVSIRIGFEYLKSRTTFGQIILVAVATLIAFAIPLDSIVQMRNAFFLLMLLVCWLAMIFLPRWIVFWVTPIRGHQLKLMKITYGVVWGLFLIQLIVA